MSQTVTLYFVVSDTFFADFQETATLSMRMQDSVICDVSKIGPNGVPGLAKLGRGGERNIHRSHLVVLVVPLSFGS